MESETHLSTLENPGDDFRSRETTPMGPGGVKERWWLSCRMWSVSISTVDGHTFTRRGGVSNRLRQGGRTT